MKRWTLACLACLALAGAAAPVHAARPAKPAPTSAAAQGATLSAAALLDSVAAHYARLSAFHFEGNLHVEVAGGTLREPNVLDVPFVYAALRPSRLRTGMHNPYMETTLVADGDSLWISAPMLHQYTVQSAPAIVPGVEGDEFVRTLDPLRGLTTLNAHVRAADELGTDTVHTDAGVVQARHLVVTYEPDTAAGAPRQDPRSLWLDEARRLVVRDSVAVHVQHPQMGALTSTQDTRYVHLDARSAGHDSLYHFVIPAGSRRVARLGAPGMDRPDHSGEMAPDFTLSGLDGKPVALSKLRGKVVVLDFWATWCGPCRRWLPIVAKVARETAAKGVKVYAVNVRETPAQVKAFLKGAGVVIPVLLDKDGAIGNAYGAASIPLTVIVGRDGKIVKTLLGLHAESDLRAALGEAGVTGL